MKALVSRNDFFTSSDFVELRDAVPARLIIKAVSIRLGGSKE